MAALTHTLGKAGYRGFGTGQAQEKQADPVALPSPLFEVP